MIGLLRWRKPAPVETCDPMDFLFIRQDNIRAFLEYQASQKLPGLAGLSAHYAQTLLDQGLSDATLYSLHRASEAFVASLRSGDGSPPSCEPVRESPGH